VISYARVALILEALRQFVGVFHGVCSETLAVFNKTVDVNAAKNYGHLRKMRERLFPDCRATDRAGCSPVFAKSFFPLLRGDVAELHKDMPIVIDIQTFRLS